MEETNQTPPQTGGKMNPMMIAAILVVIGIGAYLLLGKQNTPQTEEAGNQQETLMEETTPPSESVSDESTMEESGVLEVQMEAGSFYFTPKEIRAKLGQAVRINLTAIDLMHDFNIDELGVDGPIMKEGESTTIEFVADQAGEFEYYCSVGQHRANGQVGTLIVE
ncbi:cupredoxin domain-containing protein [Candidatus Roizmanbacteria bacterium]|nr:cupredoxin domain-containing protein [Candidatus Roizmanbacteria bacterium]